MLLFIAILFKGFSIVGQTVRDAIDLQQESRFMFGRLALLFFLTR